VVTHWDSVAVLEAFAGPRWQEAVIEPDEEHLLAEVFCDHYETVERGLTGRVRRGCWRQPTKEKPDAGLAGGRLRIAVEVPIIQLLDEYQAQCARYRDLVASLDLDTRPSGPSVVGP
jgi:hypothetical protein